MSFRNSERGVALIEAALALGLVALVAAAGLSAFSRAERVSAAAEAKLAALALAENAIERGSAPDFLSRALASGDASLEGEGWRLTGSVFEGPEAEAAESPLALIRLLAEAGPDPEAPLVRLETLRSIPR